MSETQLKPEHQLYANLMDEARLRLYAMRDAIGMRDTWTPIILQDFLHLQLRMLCEAIAFGCLIAHGDITSKRTLEEWQIREVMKRLEKMNPDFFPRGIRFRFTGGRVDLDDNPDPQITKAELLKLWEKSGSMLHRGPASRILDEYGKTISVELDPVIRAGQKIKNLLEQHRIVSADRKSYLIAGLEGDGAAGGNAVVYFAQAP